MKRFVVISLFTLLFATFIFVWNMSYQSGLEDAYIPLETKNTTLIIPSEFGVFQRSKYALDYAEMPLDENHERSLKSYYSNRAFHGAPPTIPHKIQEDSTIGESSCLKCHENGGFVQKYNAYAPVTPHPKMVNCRQCHVLEKTTGVFKQNSFDKINPPTVGTNSALVGSPPVIPHQIQMRENCLSCHAGPSAPKEIRVSHPIRVNCRQCHVPNNKEVATLGNFKRNSNE